ncbi:hypothetical protein B6D29_03625 [Microgenomates bacterium UTCPR1]|nr:MAG: hypothetical protein B6D29_03625 [Microgenomates bacterium UTCPR1]
MKQKKLLVLVTLFISFIFINPSFAQTNQTEADIQKKINEYQQKLEEIRQQKNTLSSQIQYMDTQAYLTNLKIIDTEQKIESTTKEIDILGNRIGNLDQSLNQLSELLLDKVVQGYKKRELSLLNLLFGSKDVNDLVNGIKYVKTTRDNNQKLLIQVQQAKSNFEEQKKLREEKKVELDELTRTLEEQKISLANQKVQKQRLLTETNNSETSYQSLLTQARNLLASFSTYASNQGGATILSNQTVCDDWGCYYNQRDSQWGTNSLNGTGYTLASDGCLVTSMAMVYTHLGRRSVTPQTINSNPNNFASYYPAYLQYTISADGLTTSRVRANIDSVLSTGEPVVVGVRAYGGTHFVVLVSGSNGDYLMNDPFIANGHKISFSSQYSLDSIFEITQVVTY